MSHYGSITSFDFHEDSSLSSIKKNLFLFTLLIMFITKDARSFEVQGHRGTRGYKPENTLPAFKAAIESGADRIELDLLVTKDGVIVIYHDFYINPNITTNWDGSPVSVPSPLIYSLSLAEVKQFDCGRRKNPLFPKQTQIPGTKIPTLQELLDLILEYSHANAKKIGLNLEIKRDPYHPEFTPSPLLFAKKLVDLVKKNGFMDRVYYSSFDPQMLVEVRKIDPKAHIAFLMEDNIKDLIEIATELRADIISPEHVFIKDRKDVERFHQLGFKVMLWTVNDPARSLQLLEMGVDGIITDYPNDLISFLTKKNEFTQK